MTLPEEHPLFETKLRLAEHLGVEPRLVGLSGDEQRLVVTYFGKDPEAPIEDFEGVPVVFEPGVPLFELESNVTVKLADVRNRVRPLPVVVQRRQPDGTMKTTHSTVEEAIETIARAFQRL
jgi:hypothetical protein